MVGGIMPSRRAKAEAMSSAAPVAPNMWPVIDLVELPEARRPSSTPSASVIARGYVWARKASPMAFVPVAQAETTVRHGPWAL